MTYENEILSSFILVIKDYVCLVHKPAWAPRGGFATLNWQPSDLECNALTCWVILPKYKVVLKIWMVFLMFKVSIYQINRTSEFLKGSKVMFTRNKHITKVNYDAIKVNSGFDKNLSWDSISYITVILKFWRSSSKKSLFWDCCYFKPSFLGLTTWYIFGSCDAC